MKKYLILDKKIYAENYLAITNKLGKKPAAALKNNAYGLGLLDIAPVIEEVGCRNYFIYNLAEGIALRKVLKEDSNIISLGNIEAEGINEYFTYHITPTVGSLEEIKLYKHKLLALKGFCIYFDTGLHGKGILWEEAEETYQLLKDLPIKIIVSHLSSAWKTDLTKNQLQQTRFKHIMEIFGKSITYSLTNTDGSRLGEDYTLQLPRIGRGLHGVSFYNNFFGTKPAFRIKGNITQLKRIKQNEEVGYGGYTKITEDINAAVVNLGTSHINSINFPFCHQVIIENKTYEVLTLFLGYMIVNLKQDTYPYFTEVELVFKSRFDPNILI